MCRVLCLLILAGILSSVSSSETPTPEFPLWDGHESVADYARRVNLPPAQTLDLGNGIKMELVLIPAGQFIMGVPEPTRLDEAGFQSQIVRTQAVLIASAGALLVILLTVLSRAVLQKRRPQFSLRLLSLLTFAAGGCV